MILDEKGEDVSKYEGLTLLKIAEEYPGDIGALAVYFLNEIALQPGEALFVEVNEPHAYLEGGKLESFPFGGGGERGKGGVWEFYQEIFG